MFAQVTALPAMMLDVGGSLQCSLFEHALGSNRYDDEESGPFDHVPDALNLHEGATSSLPMSSRSRFIILSDSKLTRDCSLGLCDYRKYGASLKCLGTPESHASRWPPR
jgi:hypothetical protein